MKTSAENETIWSFADKIAASGLVFENQATKSESSLDSVGSDFELIGCLGDGDWIIWTNPPVEEASTIVENLKKVLLQSDISLEESASN